MKKNRKIRAAQKPEKPVGNPDAEDNPILVITQFKKQR
jgi:hypothetical protein